MCPHVPSAVKSAFSETSAVNFTMPAKRLDGKALGEQIRREVAERVAERAADGRTPPGLAVVLVGDNPASHVYVRNKRKACEQAGIRSWLHHLPADTDQRALLDLIATLNCNPEVHGILVQLPLPPQIDEKAVIDAIDPDVDVDTFHPENVGRLAAGHPRFYPCTPHGCVQLLQRNGISTAGKEVVIVGRSNIVGKPLALMLLQKKTADNPMGGDALVTVAHTKAADLGALTRRADILIAAVGVAGLIKADMVKPGAVVIDVGMNTVDGKLCGDVDAGVWDVASAMTPVPGGVGPMTIAMLLSNTLQACEKLDG
jgi:methylenetetrahydrofolate dehydrogenase (NADP+) / methenyltetrahydrofolate cyclohydrolase